MYKVMIAEDEMLVRLGLKNSIHWENFNMEVISDVPDGQIAWEIYKNNKPDMIITDLKMPLMGGMELIEKIRKNDKETVIIILSCLEEFELVRKAMNLGVLDYMPKLTMTEEDTEIILKKAQKELDKLKKSEPVNTVSSSNIYLEKEKLVKDFVFYGINSAEEFEVHSKELKLNLNPARLVLCILEIDNYVILKSRFKDHKGQLIKLSMLNVLDELLLDGKRGEAIYDNDSHYILIFSFKDVFSEQALLQMLNEILNNIKSVIATFFSASVSFGISGVQNGYDSLKRMYKEADIALKQKFILGPGMFFSFNLLNLKLKLCEKIETLRSIPKILSHMDAGSIKEYNKRIDEIVNVLPEEKEKIKQFFYQLIQWTSNFMYIKGENSEKAIVAGNNKISKCDTLDDIVDAYKIFVSDITENVMRNKALTREVSDAVKFINLNYCKDISLQQVAECVKLSSAYLSSLFKKELQVNFVEYINELRVNKAKELLLETYLKSYEIAEKTGFSENTYFSKVFKKVTGLSPNEFRRQWMKELTEDIEDEDN
ncbi:MAG TPA: helix-turn-helix domain-containing protein [Ruminiclostridium sp.]